MTKKILIVEDEKSLQGALKQKLENAGFFCRGGPKWFRWFFKN